MTDKELAEAVAKLLGYKLLHWYSDKFRSGMYWMKDVELPVYVENFPVDKDSVEDWIFSWPVTGLMIEEMEREGWQLCVQQSFLSFYKKVIPYMNRTNEYQLSEHGYHKAIAKAYLEAKEIIKKDTDVQ